MSKIDTQKSGPAASPRVKATAEEIMALKASGVRLSRKERRAEKALARAQKFAP